MAPFCSCPASLVSRNFFAVGPGCAKCFFLLRSVGRRDLSAGPEQKKHHPGCFFLLRPRRKAREGEAPLGAGTGPEQKKTPPRVIFLLRTRSPVGRRHGARAKKKNTTQGVFFGSDPGGKAGEGEAPLGAGTGPEQVSFFCSGAQRGFSFPCLSAGPQQKKKTLGGVFFLLWPRAGTGLLLPLPFPGAGAKNKDPGWCFFFAAAPRGRSLTHCGLGGDASPSPGWCFFCCGPARTGVVFFFCCGPARTLTHSQWAGAISARPGWCFFFCCGPAGSF